MTGNAEESGNPSAAEIRAELGLNEFYKIAFESSPNGLIVVNQDGLIVLANAEAENIFGYEKGDLNGKFVEVLVPEAARPGHPVLRNAYFDDPKSRRMGLGRDLEGVRKDGSPMPVEIGLNPVMTSKGLFVLGSVVDISTRKRAEDAQSVALEDVAKANFALKELNKELESFAYVASHDLRSPLRGINNLARWIEEEITEHMTEKAQEYMGLLHSRVARLDALLNDLLEYSRAGRNSKLVLEQVNIRDLVAGIADLLPRPEGFVVEIDDGLPILNTLKAPLAQVFHNLISNALRHHDREDGRIRISASKQGAIWELCVADDGPGIPGIHHAKVFELFQTLKSRDTVEGSGMGLAIVKKLVEKQGGTVRIDTGIDGKGAAFCFTWPT